MNYLLTTKNQYFITTHSNSFINIEGLDIYHVTNDGTKSNIQKVLDAKSKNHILNDLGYHASDLLQSNYILWVEGPSDRIYLNHWIKKYSPELKERIDYSIMFYGGKLRAHLTIDENSIVDFINLIKINRNVGIVQDSDKKTSESDIDSTKQRLIDEFNKENQFNWLTDGKEIENYIPFETIDKFRKEIVTNEDAIFEIGTYAKLTSYKIGKEEKKINKIDLAKRIVGNSPELSDEVLSKINELVAAIKKANNKI